jgi:hypothetical protein
MSKTLKSANGIFAVKKTVNVTYYKNSFLSIKWYCERKRGTLQAGKNRGMSNTPTPSYSFIS